MFNHGSEAFPVDQRRQTEHRQVTTIVLLESTRNLHVIELRPVYRRWMSTHVKVLFMCLASSFESELRPLTSKNSSFIDELQYKSANEDDRASRWFPSSS